MCLLAIETRLGMGPIRTVAELAEAFCAAVSPAAIPPGIKPPRWWWRRELMRRTTAPGGAPPLAARWPLAS